MRTCHCENVSLNSHKILLAKRSYRPSPLLTDYRCPWLRFRLSIKTVRISLIHVCASPVRWRGFERTKVTLGPPRVQSFNGHNQNTGKMSQWCGVCGGLFCSVACVCVDMCVFVSHLNIISAISAWSLKKCIAWFRRIIEPSRVCKLALHWFGTATHNRIGGSFRAKTPFGDPHCGVSGFVLNTSAHYRHQSFGLPGLVGLAWRAITKTSLTFLTNTRETCLRTFLFFVSRRSDGSRTSSFIGPKPAHTSIVQATNWCLLCAGVHFPVDRGVASLTHRSKAVTSLCVRKSAIRERVRHDLQFRKHNVREGLQCHPPPPLQAHQQASIRNRRVSTGTQQTSGDSKHITDTSTRKKSRVLWSVEMFNFSPAVHTQPQPSAFHGQNKGFTPSRFLRPLLKILCWIPCWTTADRVQQRQDRHLRQLLPPPHEVVAVHLPTAAKHPQNHRRDVSACQEMSTGLQLWPIHAKRSCWDDSVWIGETPGLHWFCVPPDLRDSPTEFAAHDPNFTGSQCLRPRIPRTTGLGYPASVFKARIVSLPCSCGHCVLSDLRWHTRGRPCREALHSSGTADGKRQSPVPSTVEEHWIPSSVQWTVRASTTRETPHQVCADHQLGQPSRRSRRKVRPHTALPNPPRGQSKPPVASVPFFWSSDRGARAARTTANSPCPVGRGCFWSRWQDALEHAPPFLPFAPTTVDGDSVADNALQKPNQASFIAVRESCNSSSRLRATAELKDSCLAPSGSYLTMWSTLESPRKSRPSTSTRSPVRVPRTKTTFPWPSSCTPLVTTPSSVPSLLNEFHEGCGGRVRRKPLDHIA